MLDTLAGSFFGIFLLSVAVKGNAGDMITLAKRDKAFLQWAVAVGILVYLHGIPELQGAVRWLIVLAFVGLLLTKGDTIKQNVIDFWGQIGGTSAPNTGAVTGSW